MSPGFETGAPSSLAEIRAGFARLHAEAERFLATIDDDELVAPQGEKWSPADHVRHLTRSLGPVARALALPRLLLRLRFGRPRTPPRSFLEIRETYLGRLRDGVQAGRFAPPPRAPGDPAAFRAEVLARWRSAGLALDRAAARWSERALDRVALPHPALGLVSVREMLFFSLYHEAHHLRLVASRRPDGAAARAGSGPPAGTPIRQAGWEAGLPFPEKV